MNCTFLSFGDPAKPGITKDLIDADDIGRKAVQTSLTHFKLKICLSQPHQILQANKVLRLARSRRNCPKHNQPDESLKERLW